MTKDEILIRELCREVAEKGIHTDRFTELWMQSGVALDSCEFEIANKILASNESKEATLYRKWRKTIH